MIRHHSQPSLVWRCVPVLQLAAHLSATAPEPLVTLPLDDLHSWERNGMLQRVKTSESRLPILRLAVDPFGISKVERLLEQPEYAGECTSRSTFIIVQDGSAPKVVAQLKVRRQALCFPMPTAPTITMSCRTDACVLHSQADLLFKSGTLPHRRASHFAEGTPPMSHAAKTSTPSKWTK